MAQKPMPIENNITDKPIKRMKLSGDIGALLDFEQLIRSQKNSEETIMAILTEYFTEHKTAERRQKAFTL